MKNRSMIALLAAVVLLIAISGCSAIPQAVRNLFASATPTATNTPTATPTSTNTPTATATPLPAVSLEPCPYIRYCPDARGVWEFFNEDTLTDPVTVVEVPYDEPISFNLGWITAMYEQLDQNKQHMHWVLEIDGQDYYREDFTAEDLAYQDDGSTWPSIYTGVITRGWVIGEPHTVRIGLSFDEAINDGWDDYPAGYEVVNEYIVNPIFIPTSTPTLTPSPTYTPKPIPTMVPYTPTPSCKLDGKIDIKNDTGGQVTLYLKGPASFTFYISSGNQTLSVCKGTYSYTAYGCGGASTTGSITTNGELKFWCQ
jgi:hypothetical protein